MDRDELDLFERSLRAVTINATGVELDEELDEVGWPDAMRSEPAPAISLLFEAQGEAGSTSSALDLVLAHGLGLESAGPLAVVLPPAGAWDPPGRLDGDGLHVRGLATAALPDGPTAEVVATVAPDGDDHEGTAPVEVVVTVETSELELRAVEGVDPRLGLWRVSADDVGPVAPLRPVPTSWNDGVALARLALAHELVGASRTMLAMAREHALERVQFGVPIASFQAVRHRLAETLVAVETAHAAADAAWLDLSPTSALIAKATAGRESRVAMKHCQQVLAGIGFTTEHDLHHFVRRALILDSLFGTARTLTRRLGAELVASRRLPPLLPL
ncbi:MAG TPA: acyl-CoA dehydrogenase family protein [Acidimicrobiales bacterium]